MVASRAVPPKTATKKLVRKDLANSIKTIQKPNKLRLLSATIVKNEVNVCVCVHALNKEPLRLLWTEWDEDVRLRQRR